MSTEVQAAHPRTERSSKAYFRPELDVLRFIAFLCVFVHHAYWRIGHSQPAGVQAALRLAGDAGGFGMCLFFLLSAYLITELLRREREATGDVSLRLFYLRRILRIWPLYFGFLALCWIDGRYVFRWEERIETLRVLAFVFMLGNWYSARFGWTGNPAAPLWSISLEEQFYLIWPPLFRKAGPRGAALAAIVLIPASMTTILLLDRYSNHINPGIWVNSLVQFQYFAIGALFALGWRGRAPAWPPGARLGVLAAGFGLWLWAAYRYPIFDPQPGRPWPQLAGYECVALGAALIFAAMLGAPGKWMPRPIVYLGKISYGLYVFHYFCLGLGHHLQAGLAHFHLAPHAHAGVQRVALGFLATIACAIASYHLFETPFLKLKERLAVIRSRPV